MMKRYLAIIAVLLAASISVCAIQPVKKQTRKTNVVDSIAVILQQAQAGNAAAQNTVGLWYYVGKDTIRQDYVQALQWWARAAKQDNADAIGNMAMCYQLGRGTERDSAMAVKLYESAIKKGNKSVIPQHEKLADKGSIFSSLLLRECYIKGIGLGKSPQKATEYLEKAAKAGHESSQYTLALQLLNGKQPEKAAAWFKKAAKQGHAGATYYYGNMLHKGTGVKQDKQSGIALLKQAAVKDFVMANYQLGLIYKDGDGVEKDAAKAFSYIKKAAWQGSPYAQWLLGMMYLNGEGIAQDYYFAAQWLAEQAVTTHKKEINELLKADNEGPFSQYLMGLRKYYVDKDYEAAIDCFKKVEKADNIEGTTMLAVCLADKDYKKRNLKKAIKQLTKAAASSPAAQYYLSAMYETGTGVDKDDAKAVELLKLAADKGVAYAQCKLGDRYIKGNGVEQNATKAALLYLDAEAQNHLTPQSAKNLAECYKQKLAVLPDLQNTDKRIEQLGKQKANGNLINLLKLLEK